MVTTPKITLGDVTIVGGSYGDHEWPQTLGIQPPRVAWRMSVSDATKILAGPRETTIEVVDVAGNQKSIKRVYVVGEESSPDEKIRTVILTDVRYLLAFTWVRAQYNVQTESGTLRQVVADGLPSAFLKPVQNLIYAPYSLKGSDAGNSGAPWKHDEIGADVLTRATTGHDFPDITVRVLARKRTTGLILPNVFVDAPGDQALGQVLGAVGGLDIRVADDGAIELVDAYLGAEKAVCDALVKRYTLEWKGRLRFVSMSNVAPRAGDVLYTRRVEVRADSFETSPDGSASLPDDYVWWGQDNSPTMINALRVVDPVLPQVPAVGALPAQANVVQGTLLPVAQWCAGVAALGDAPTSPASGAPAAQPLTKLYLLQGEGAGVGSSSPLMSNKLELNFRVQDIGQGFSDVKWAARCQEIHEGVRYRYQLNPIFARQCVPGSIKAERCGLLDAATATRQPATVYMDYVQRPLGPGWAPSDKFGWCVNSIPGTAGDVQGYPSGMKTYASDNYPTAPFLLSSAKPAPWAVDVEDPTTGVFRFRPTANRELRSGACTIPTLIWALPTISPAEINRGNAIANWAQGKLLLTHRVALVFSATPGGPNNAMAFQKYRVSVAEALGVLGAPSSAVSAKGPVKEMRVREAQVEARIPWDDAQRINILGCFSNNGVGDPSALTPVNDQELAEFARAVFANFLAAVLDHYEGTMTVGFTPSLMPIGSLQQVIHSFGSDGRFYTTAVCRGTVPIPPPENLISQASRNILFRGIT